MSDVYSRLAKKLDGLPQGFPPTDSGVEIRILEKIFSPEEAETALKIKGIPETAEAIAENFGKPVEEMRTILDDMATKGQIGCFKMGGEQAYMLFPFVVGIYEFQMYRIDKEFTELFEEYAPTLLKTVGGYAPAMARTVPVHEHIEAKSQIHLYEDIRKMVNEAKSFNLDECICRKEQALEGHRCDHSLERCLSFSNEENAYDYFSLGGRIISKEEALEVIDKAEEEGLIHNTFYNVKEGHRAVCNCCSCCCGLLRGAKDYNAPHFFAKSNFVAVLDQDSCEECGICAEERCPVDAIIEEDDGYSVISDNCIGCGVCTVTCPTDSIKLVPKPESEQDEPPDNIMEWYMERANNRGIELKLD